MDTIVVSSLVEDLAAVVSTLSTFVALVDTVVVSGFVVV